MNLLSYLFYVPANQWFEKLQVPRITSELVEVRICPCEPIRLYDIPLAEVLFRKNLVGQVAMAICNWMLKCNLAQFGGLLLQF